MHFCKLMYNMMHIPHLGTVIVRYEDVSLTPQFLSTFNAGHYLKTKQVPHPYHTSMEDIFPQTYNTLTSDTT